MAGLYFAYENEAQAFYNKVVNRDNLRIQPRTSTASVHGKPANNASAGASAKSPGVVTSIGGGPKDGKRKIDKSQIGTPTNFRHLTHIGWDPERGFSVCIH